MNLLSDALGSGVGTILPADHKFAFLQVEICLVRLTGQARHTMGRSKTETFSQHRAESDAAV
jgi:hypothetical protein